MHHDDTTPDTIPYGYCHCGCGKKTAICTHTHKKHHRQKGEPNRFIQGHAAAKLIPVADSDGIKVCSICRVAQPVSGFYQKVASRDGYYNKCKACHKAYKKAHPEISRKYNKSHPEILDKAKRRWQKENPDKHRSICRNSSRNRTAKKRTNGGHISRVEWQSVLDRFDGKCAKCGSSENIHMDHVVPLSRGGAHSIDNVQPLCQTCNLRKHTKTEDYRGKFYKLVALPLDDTA